MNDAQRAADEALRVALIAHAEAYDIVPDDGAALLSDFAVVAAWARANPDDETTYTTHYSADKVPSHIVVGLFRVGMAITIDGWAPDPD